MDFIGTNKLIINGNGDEVKEWLVAFLSPLFTWLFALVFRKGSLPEDFFEDAFEHLFFWPLIVGFAVLFIVELMTYLNPSFAGAHN